MKINNFDIDDKIIESIIFEVRSKKTLKFMDEKFILNEIKKYLSNHLTTVSKLNNKKSKEFEAIIKHVRSKCHDIYEIFQTRDIEKRNELLDMIKTPNKENIIPLLSIHISTKERLLHYETIYKKIFEITSIPTSILDIGCGFNPLSIPFMDLNITKLKYYASEISKEDSNFIKDFFLKYNINGDVFSCNIVKEYEKLSEYQCDLCFAFKLFDVLESQEKNISYEIINSLKCKWLIASFSLKNIKNEQMKREKPYYFERMLNNLNYKFEVIALENELFYVINLNKKSKIL